VRKIVVVLAGVLATAAVAVPVVLAGEAGAHFVGTPSITISGSTLTVSGKVAGLGSVDQINVTVTATAACINPGSNKPKAANKQSVTAQGTFPVQNGKAEFSLSATAAFQPPCDPPMTVEWSNVTITVTATGVNLTFP
jgi:hypothetical protein